jgi:hypothetical protein
LREFWYYSHSRKSTRREFFRTLIAVKLKESIDKHVYVKIEWSDKCVRDGDLKISRNQLKKTKWNPNVPVGGAW